MPTEKEPLEKLWIWTEAQDLAHIIYDLLKEVKGNFKMKDQIDRSSQSVCDNISEMYGAYYYKAKKQALRISRREAYETKNHVEKFKRRNLWDYTICKNLDQRYERLIKGINKYIGYISEWEEKDKNK